MLDQLNHTVCMSDNCIDYVLFESQFASIAQNNTVLIKKSLFDIVTEYLVHTKGADPCNQFTNAVDTFYEKIKGHGITENLIPLPESISCIIQRCISLINGVQSKPLEQLHPNLIEGVSNDEVIRVSTTMIIAGLACAVFGAKMAGGGRLRILSKSAVIGFGLYQIVTGSLNLVAIALQNAVFKGQQVV